MSLYIEKYCWFWKQNIQLPKIFYYESGHIRATFTKKNMRDNIIKLRINSETKEQFKKAADNMSKGMSELLESFIHNFIKIN